MLVTCVLVSWGIDTYSRSFINMRLQTFHIIINAHFKRIKFKIRTNQNTFVSVNHELRIGQKIIHKSLCPCCVCFGSLIFAHVFHFFTFQLFIR